MTTPTKRSKGILAGTLLIITAAASAGGCAATAVKYYEPLSVAAATPTDHRWQALTTMMSGEGWKVERADQARGELVAVRVSAEDAKLRERVTVTVDKKETVVAVQTEMFSEGHWWGSAGACRTYAYARENALAQRLEASPSPGQLASAR